MAQIYILDDDDAFATSVGEALTRCGHVVQCFGAPHEFFYRVSRMPPRIAIVDWMLPEMSGYEVVRRLRHSIGARIGVIMLTALDSEDKAVDVLGAGADDYLVKPITDALLTVRVEALLRRLMPAELTHAKRLAVGPYLLDLPTRSITVSGEAVEIAPREFDLAWTFFSHPSRLFTKEELLAAIWGKQTALGCHTIAQHVYALRKKLALAEHGFRLLSVYATGYRLEHDAGANIPGGIRPMESASAPAAAAL